jgi:hypothetical protein
MAPWAVPRGVDPVVRQADGELVEEHGASEKGDPPHLEPSAYRERDGDERDGKRGTGMA